MSDGDRNESSVVRSAGIDRLSCRSARHGERNVGDGRYASLIEQAEALIDLDAKGKLAPHGIGGLARELLAKCIAAISDLNDENCRVWDALTISDADARQWFIGDIIRRKGFLNRSAICEAFKVSTPQASADIQKWIASHPGKIAYNASAKRYERASLPTSEDTP